MSKILTLSVKASQFTIAYSFPNAHRTSNILDPLMSYQDCLLVSMQCFHGSQYSANLALAQWLSCGIFIFLVVVLKKNSTDTVSPFEKLNGFSYHPNWLRNFLIASSINGRDVGKFRKYTIRQN
ncbi:MAG: hypothetical protein VKL41_01175 [Snowella sp.]|nr:hypothetical protein [Snowella sp.]